MKIIEIIGVLLTIITTSSSSPLPAEQTATYQPFNPYSQYIQPQQQQDQIYGGKNAMNYSPYDSQMTSHNIRQQFPRTDSYNSEVADAPYPGAASLNEISQRPQQPSYTYQPQIQQSQPMYQQQQIQPQRSQSLPMYQQSQIQPQRAQSLPMYQQQIQPQRSQSLPMYQQQQIQPQPSEPLYEESQFSPSRMQNVPASFAQTPQRNLEMAIVNNQHIIRLPYPRSQLPHNGTNYPTPDTDQYDRADYDEKWRLYNKELRKFNPLDNSLAGAGSAFIGGVKGIWEVVRHPIKTAKKIGTGVWNLIRHPITTTKAIETDIAENTRRKGLANEVGSFGFDVASILTPVGVGEMAGSIGAQLGEKLGALGSEAAQVGKIGAASEVAANEAAQVGKIGAAGEIAANEAAIAGNAAAVGQATGSEASQFGKFATGAGVALDTTGQVIEGLGPVAQASDMGVLTQRYQENEKMKLAQEARAAAYRKALLSGEYEQNGFAPAA